MTRNEVQALHEYKGCKLRRTKRRTGHACCACWPCAVQKGRAARRESCHDGWHTAVAQKKMRSKGTAEGKSRARSTSGRLGKGSLKGEKCGARLKGRARIEKLSQAHQAQGPAVLAKQRSARNAEAGIRVVGGPRHGPRPTSGVLPQSASSVTLWAGMVSWGMMGVPACTRRAGR